MSIRLIAADMDGTLLDSRKQLPEGLFPLVRALHERGVRFAPASGRQFYTLYEQFGEIADELMYISENGAMICDGAECVGFSAMPRDVVLDVIERVRTLPGAYTVISARSGGFYEKNGEKFETEASGDVEIIVTEEFTQKTDGEGKLYEDRLKAVARERFSDKDMLSIETKLIEPKTYLITLRYVVLAK